MSRLRCMGALLFAVTLLPGPLSAQDWNSPGALALVRHGIEARERAGLDPALHRYRARADGIVRFLLQLGPEPASVPHLVKADQVVAEVYWQAPNRSKQIIVGWRERRYLPTDIRYHRDHLGIVTNDFGAQIRVGEGDEVGDVVHPLSAIGVDGYDYALGDSVVIRPRAPPGGRTDGGPLRLREVLFRPRDPAAPAAVGSMHLDVESGALVRFRFGFTRAAYLEAELEDITILLENALFDQRHWLPWRQEIEIRRRNAWLDVPLRTIIRGQWQLGDYDFEAVFPPSVFAGGPYGGPAAAWPDTGWADPLERVLSRDAGSISRTDLTTIRRQAQVLLGTGPVLFRPPARLAFGGLSDLAHVNRVQGLALGLGGSFRAMDGIALHPRVEYGLADGRVLGGFSIEWSGTRARAGLYAGREITDFAEEPVISGLLNSILAQEGGSDFGDYVLIERVEGRAELATGGGTRADFSLGVERSRSLVTGATPLSGEFAPNPGLGVGTVTAGRVGFTTSGEIGQARVAFEGGVGSREYVRVRVDARGEAPAGPGRFTVRLQGGAGTRHLPAYRSFALGGRGTLVGEPFRAYGGRLMLLGRVEWAFPVPVPEVELPTGGTGRTAILAPFLAAGWVAGMLDGGPEQPASGIRPVLGVASELLFRGLRVEVGWSPRAGRLGLVADMAPGWWPVL